MKSLILLYSAVCVAAIGLKWLMGRISHWSKDKHAPGHEHSHTHDQSHLIKFIILLVLAALIMFGVNRGA